MSQKYDRLVFTCQTCNKPYSISAKNRLAYNLAAQRIRKGIHIPKCGECIEKGRLNKNA